MADKKVTHVTDERPWGSYEVLLKEKTFQVKRIQVKPHQRLSLQKHSKRAEKWVVTQGKGLVSLGEKEVPVERGSLIEVAIGESHRMANTGDEPLVFVEVQLGDYLEEDDIIRLEDDYKRS